MRVTAPGIEDFSDLFHDDGVLGATGPIQVKANIRAVPRGLEDVIALESPRG